MGKECNAPTFILVKMHSDHSATPMNSPAFVAAVLAQDRDAIDAFESQVRTGARRQLLGMGLSRSDAESLAATCVTEVFLRLEKFRGGSLEAWIKTVVGNVFWDHVRAWRRSVPTVADGAMEVRAEDGAAARRAAPEVRRAVAAALAQLSPGDNLIIQLRYCAEPVAYEEISRILGMSEGAVRVRCLRLRQKLETYLRADPNIVGRIRRCDSLSQNKYEQPET
jgi:RNA polymerase sigma factor (sigma-70 family)